MGGPTRGYALASIVLWDIVARKPPPQLDVFPLQVQFVNVQIFLTAHVRA
jgi:hypothetical protein